MFDVLWTDPSRELVGERLIRKEQEAKAKEKDKSSETGRRSTTTSHSSSSSERGLGLFSSMSRRHRRKTSSTRMTSVTNSQCIPDDEQDRRGSAYRVRSLLANKETSDLTVKNNETPYLAVRIPGSGDMASTLSSPDSEISKWTQPSAVTTGTWAGMSVGDSTFTSKSEQLAHAVDAPSFVTGSTDLEASPRSEDLDLEQIISDVHISGENNKIENCSPQESPEKPSMIQDTFDDFETSTSPPLVLDTPPPSGSQSEPEPRTNKDGWRPPSEWEFSPTKHSQWSPPRQALCDSPHSTDLDLDITPGTLALQRDIRIMMIASSDLILANLKAAMRSGSDAVVYKELEMTKKRWMFSYLHQQGGYGDFLRAPNDSEGTTPFRTPRILALHETPASASFLAALHPRIPLYHVSKNPVSRRLFPNALPLPASSFPTKSIGSKSLIFPPGTFTAVTCLSMPALFPSADIPPALSIIHQCLAPGGALYLTLIDPQPEVETLGPKLRKWLFEHLVVNLERKFRTTCPSITFPSWLSGSCLRGKGSTIAELTAKAVAEDTDQCEFETDPRIELHSLVVRQLWREIWGPFVQADCWWWDEEELVEECRSLGTTWRYRHIVAVKDLSQTLQV